jgi:hypothetical protein
MCKTSSVRSARTLPGIRTRSTSAFTTSLARGSGALSARIRIGAERRTWHSLPRTQKDSPTCIAKLADAHAVRSFS